MSIFADLKSAQLNESGRRLPDGEHVVAIEKCLTKRSEQLGTDLYIVEFLVTESVTAEKGGRYSWVQNNKDPRLAQSRIKEFVLAVMKADKEKDSAKWQQCVDQCEAIAVASVEKGFFKDQTVRVIVQTATSKAGHSYKKHNFKAAA